MARPHQRCAAHGAARRVDRRRLNADHLSDSVPSGLAVSIMGGTVSSVSDAGYFGPGSASWQVNGETTVLFGGARALLMHAAHPLVIAGARQTGFYERDAWKRLERTLQLQYTITFGTRAEADAAAARVRRVHDGIHGIDAVSGMRYDAHDPDLLLWVHACLV